MLYNFCCNHGQDYSQMSGHRMGLRMEAVVAALDELCLMGHITDRSQALLRVFVIDDVVNTVLNDRLDAESASRRASS